jgi:hypothetical protein
MLATTSRSQMLRALLNPKLAAASARAFRVTAPGRMEPTSASYAKSAVPADGFAIAHMDADEETPAAKPQAAVQSGFPVMMLSRFTKTAEVTVSKIFPAGFGWQAASVVAGNAGAAPTSLPFFMMTGFGDLLGVLGGHVGYMALKKQAGFKVDLSQELDTGLWLGSAAFCSGFVWQPTLNICVDAGLSFNQSMTGVFGACTLAFFGGLRAFRYLYSPLTSIEPNNYANLKADVGLAVAVGGATGCFVGTDVTFADNIFLRPVVGIEEGTSDLAAQIIAGSSTALGFMAVQSAQNVAMPKGKNWIGD